jgi:DNA mismatch repair ATPase MutS
MSETPRLQLDCQTLRESEIFADTGGGSGLCRVLDRTKTRLGSSILKQKLSQPFVEIRAIQGAQRDFAFLRANPIPVPFTDALMLAAERYTRSRVEVAQWSGAGSRLAAVRQALRYRDVRDELSGGAAAAIGLAREAGAYCQMLLHRGPSGRLEKTLRETVAAAAGVEAAGRGFGGSAWSVVRCDARLRGDGRGQLERLVAGAAELDALTCLAAFGVDRGYCVPEMVDGDPCFSVTGLRHPQLAEPVGNDFALDHDDHVVFLTGPNMAGKTTFLKSVGVAQLLAQVGLLAPAQALRLSPVDAVFTALTTADDLTAGVSYYLAEVRRMKQAAELVAGCRRTLILVDEAFRGTNVLDATEATRLVVAGFDAVAGCTCLFASHLASLGPDLAKHGVVLKSFAGDVHDGLVSFDHRLRDGTSDQRLGLLLLEQEGVLRLLASVARTP